MPRLHAIFATASLCAVTLATPPWAEDAPPPVDQLELNALVLSGQSEEAFLQAFEAGDELTEFSFDASRGVGANVGQGRRFARVPRADLAGDGEWAQHFPTREGGPNATSCIACHAAPAPNGAGDVALNVVVDPGHTGDPALFLERNTPALFALGIPQRLAEEMTLELATQRLSAEAEACANGTATTELSAKGVGFGTLTLERLADSPCKLQPDSSQLSGIDADLVVKPFGWKGSHASLRGFTRDAAHNELGMQAVELVGDQDGDFDGVTDELTVGDLTALTIYMAALERPVSTVELANLGLQEMSEAQRRQITRGEVLFALTDCSSCHIPQMTLNDPTFSEPSRVAGYVDTTLPSGADPVALGLTADSAIHVDLTQDQPNNQITLANGATHHLGAVERRNGRAIARWFTDFKRHDMGAALADPADPTGLGAATFMTRSLAGVGSTGPWLHDGRATTLDEAIRLHGGAAADSRSQYVNLSQQAQEAIVAFLEAQVIYTSGEEDH